MSSGLAPLRVAIVGAGGIANSVHLPSLTPMKDVSIVAVCDLIEDKAISTAERFHIPKTYTNYLTMLQNEQIDAAFILVQPDQSFRIALNCMQRNIHTFIEKPAGITLYQAQTLQRESEKHNTICQVGFNRRHIPMVSKIVETMRKITPIEQVMGCFVKHGDAAFYDGCASAYMCDTIHVIDTVRWIAGGNVENAATVIMRNDSPVDNAWNSVMRFDNGVTGMVSANYNAGGRVHNFEIHGPNASAYLNIGFGAAACDAEIVHFAGRGTFSLSSAGPGKQEIEYIDGLKLAGSSEYHIYYGYEAEDIEFISCVRSGNKPLCNIGEAVESMALVEYLEQKRI